MDKHINMYYDEPRIIKLKVKNNLNGYTAVHDQFGDNYVFKKKIDDEYDEIEVTASADAVVNFAVQYMDYVEIIRPQALKGKIIQKAKQLMNKYNQ